MSGGTVHSHELVCRRGCGYEVSVGNAVPSAVRRLSPDECPRCGASVGAP